MPQSALFVLDPPMSLKLLPSSRLGTKAPVFGANPVPTLTQERIWVDPANKGSNLTRYQASIMQEIDGGAA
jgi:hypothetical protein